MHIRVELQEHILPTRNLDISRAIHRLLRLDHRQDMCLQTPLPPSQVLELQVLRHSSPTLLELNLDPSKLMYSQIRLLPSQAILVEINLLLSKVMYSQARLLCSSRILRSLSLRRSNLISPKARCRLS